MYNHSELGLWGETQAAQFLKKKRLKILAQNYETKYGEIDIVCLQSKHSARWQKKNLQKQAESETNQVAQRMYEAQSDLLVFVEVKTRNQESANRVAPQEAVNKAKQKKYAQLAEQFCQSQNYNLPMRFDIVEVVVCGKNATIHHIENAF